MQDIPLTVLQAFNQRKTQENNRIELRRINKHYYVYKATSIYNKQLKKPVKM